MRGSRSGSAAGPGSAVGSRAGAGSGSRGGFGLVGPRRERHVVQAAELDALALPVGDDGVVIGVDSGAARRSSASTGRLRTRSR